MATVPVGKKEVKVLFDESTLNELDSYIKGERAAGNTKLTRHALLEKLACNMLKTVNTNFKIQ